jgi:hypothetical protein
MLIVPKHDNEGRPLGALQDSIAADMVAAFGGVTARDATGYWSDDGRTIKEPVTELVAACEVGPACNRTMRRIADQVAREGRQAAVYLRYADGDVEIIYNQNERVAA